MKTAFTLFIICLFSYSSFAQPGTLDSSFGTDGMFLDTSISAYSNAIALQPDGKILTGGYAPDLKNANNYGGIFIARYNSNASIDKSFGVNGKVIIRQIQSITVYSIKTIIVQPDNKILALARVVPGRLYSDVGLIRLKEDGSLDNSFGANGFVFTSLSKWEDVLGGMVLQSDGKIVVTGNKQTGESQPGPDFLLRYLPDGNPDESFGNKGQVFTYYESNIKPGAVILQPDGKIVTGDKYGVTTNQFQLVRYNKDGTLDEGFGTNGIARLKPSSGYFTELNSLAIQNDGKILAAGRYGEVSMALARFDDKGNPDLSFGNLGGYTYFYTPDIFAIARSVFITSDKKIMLTGNYYINPAIQIAAVKYNNNGIIDSSFGENGVAAGGFENTFGSDLTSGVGVLQPDGKIIVSGSFAINKSGYNYNVGLLRFNDKTTKKQIIIKKIKHYAATHNNAQATLLNSVSIYPNPAQNVLHVAGLSSNKATLTIIDFMGNVKLQTVANTFSYNLNTAALTPGNYLLKIEMNDAVVTKKFVKE